MPDSRAIPVFSTRCFPQWRSSLYDFGRDMMSVIDYVELFNRQDATPLKSRTTLVNSIQFNFFPDRIN